jgi:hypothetical protein
VPRAEISELLALSPTGVEALLARARSSFREELEADAQPFDCAETRALAEQQLEGLITVAERHSLRAHLRHCSPCSTLARAVRSSRGKLASLLFWPAELISRLASAFSQAPTAVHVAGAISTAAVVASVAIPVAVLHNAGASHVEGRPAPEPVTVVHPASSSVAQPSSTSRTALVRKPTEHARALSPARSHAQRSASRIATAATMATVASGRPSETAAPVPISSQPAAAQGPTASQPIATAPRSTSPATRPSARPKPKPARRASKRRGGRHSPSPPDQMPASVPPAATLPPPDNGAENGAGPGFSAGISATSAGDPTEPLPAGSDSPKSHGKH